jgi:hypothetical protein
MVSRANDWVDQFPDFHELSEVEQIARLVYFHTVVEKRATVSLEELETLFGFINVLTPRNLPKILAYMCGQGRRLISSSGEYSLQRQVRQQIDAELEELTGKRKPQKIGPVPAFELTGKTFNDKKVEVLLDEVKKCYALECWNACGILTRIILERTLDSVDPKIKAAGGLKDKLNIGISTAGLFSKSIVETLKELKNAKLVGDIVAHHSTILLDKHDIDVVSIPLRVLLREVTTI